MIAEKGKKEAELKVEIGSNNAKQWTEVKVGRLKTFARNNAKQRSDEQNINNKLMALRFEIDDYLSDASSKTLTIDDVVRTYLKVLKLPFRKFAIHLDTTDSNLKKYVRGERKFNKDLALKFSHFFHTPAELWLQLQLKNELIELRSRKETKQYAKYDYRKLIGKDTE